MILAQVWVCRPGEARVTITLVRESFFARVSNIIFFNGVCKTRLFILVFCAKVAHAQINLLSRTPCVKELLCARKTNNKASFTHSVKKNRVRYTWPKRVIIARVFLSPSLRSGDKLHPCENDPLRSLLSKITILTQRAQNAVFLCACEGKRAQSGHFVHGVWKKKF